MPAPMLKSCLRWLLLYLFITAVLSALVYTRYPDVRAALIGGGVAAIFVWFSIGYINGMRERKTERRMIQRGMTVERPEDGEKIAAVGALRSMESLEAPISKRRCLAYEYNMRTQQQETTSVYSGFALVPLTIETPRGSIRLLAAPELAFDEETFGAAPHRQNAREYVAATTFKQHLGLDIKREVAHLKTVVADDDGRIRFDVQHDKGVDAASLDFAEKVLLPGEKVVAVGRYSAARGGLVPDPTALMHPVKIVKGDGDEVLRKLKSKDRTERFMSCGCLIPVVLAALVGLALVPLAAIEQLFPRKDPTWTEVRVERWVRRNIRPYLKADDVAIDLDSGRARGKLFVDGHNVSLATASLRADGNWRDLTLRGEGSVAVARFLGPQLESLRIGGREVPVADAELEQFAMTETAASGRITYLGPRGGPHLRAAFRATTAPPDV